MDYSNIRQRRKRPRQRLRVTYHPHVGAVALRYANQILSSSSAEFTPPWFSSSSSSPSSPSARDTAPIEQGQRCHAQSQKAYNQDAHDNPLSTALYLYTDILSGTCPGHPGAFLNRSLCYLLLDKPHLAAYDARRAIMAAHYAVKGPRGNVYQRQLLGCHEAALGAGLAVPQGDSEKAADGEGTETIFDADKGPDGKRADKKQVASVVIETRSEARREIEKFRSEMRLNGGDQGPPARWVIYPWCYVCSARVPYLNTNLASLLVRALECKKRDKSREISQLATDVTIKGYYRLALALWRCGGGGEAGSGDGKSVSMGIGKAVVKGKGVLLSALDVLSEAESLYDGECSVEDREALLSLGNRILEDLGGLMGVPGFFGHWSHRNTRGTEHGPVVNIDGDEVKRLIQARYTTVKNERYLWDERNLTGGEYLDVEALTKDSSFKRIFPRCDVDAASPSLSTSSGAATFAKPMDVYARVRDSDGAILAASEGLRASSDPWTKRSIFCNHCAARMNISLETLEYVLDGMSDSRRSSGHTTAALDNKAKPDTPDAILAGKKVSALSEEKAKVRHDAEEKNGHPNPLAANPILPLPSSPPPQGSTLTIPPTSLPAAPSPPHNTMSTEDFYRSTRNAAVPSSESHDFQICATCRQTAFCSLRCYVAAIDYHMSVCETGLEEYMSAGVIDVNASRSSGNGRNRQENEGDLQVDEEDEETSIPPPKKQKLIGLLVLKALGMAKAKGTSPLQVSIIRFLKLGDAPAPREDHLKTNNDLRTQPMVSVPWSYDANVLRPLHCLFTMGGSALALNVKEYDGWMIDTLFAKVYRCLQVTKGERIVKAFDRRGMVEEERVCVPEIWMGNRKSKQQSGKEESRSAGVSLREENGFEPGTGESQTANRREATVGSSSRGDGKEGVWIGSLDVLPEYIPSESATVEASTSKANVQLYSLGTSMICVPISASNPRDPTWEDVSEKSPPRKEKLIRSSKVKTVVREEEFWGARRDANEERLGDGDRREGCAEAGKQMRGGGRVDEGYNDDGEDVMML